MRVLMGRTPSGENVDYTDVDAQTHLGGWAPTRSGKSRLIANMADQRAKQQIGELVIDPKHTLAAMLAEHFAYVLPRMPVLCLRLSDPELIFPMNPFTELAPEVSANLVAQLEGVESSQAVPMIEQVLTCFFALVQTGKIGIAEAVDLFVYEHFHWRLWALEQLTDPTIRAMWKEIVDIRRPDVYQYQVGSSVRRLLRLSRNPQLRRLFGLPKNTLEYHRWLTEPCMVILDTSPSPEFSPESARLATNVILHGLYREATALPEPLETGFYLVIDEAQELLTQTPLVKEMLDRMAWSNVHLEIFCQQTAQMKKFGQDWLYHSVLNDCQVKLAWAGLHPLSALVLAEDMFAADDEHPRTLVRRITDAPYRSFWFSQPQQPTLLVQPQPFVLRPMSEALTQRRIREEFILPFGPMRASDIEQQLAERRWQIDAEAWKLWRERHPKEPGKSPRKPSEKPSLPSPPVGPDREDEEEMTFRSTS